MKSITDFFEKLFAEFKGEESTFIIFFLVTTFLLGLIFGWWAARRGKKKLRKTLKARESELVTLKAEHTGYQEQLGLKEADITKAHLEVEELKTRVSQVEHEKAQMDSLSYDHSSEVETLQAENAAHVSQIEALDAKIARLESEALQHEELLETAASNATSNVDLSAVQSNYDNANLRLAAIEEKISRIERENSTLKSELSSLKDNSSSTIAFVDEEPNVEDEEIETFATTIDEDMAPEERSARARQNLRAAFGTRITTATAADKDDLKKINGIGPFIEQKLNDIGIYTFKQIGQLDDDLIQQVTDAIQFFPGRINRDDWVGQAKGMEVA